MTPWNSCWRLSSLNQCRDRELSQTGKHLLIHYFPFLISLPLAWFSIQRNLKIKSAFLSPPSPNSSVLRGLRRGPGNAPKRWRNPRGPLINLSADLRATCQTQRSGAALLSIPKILTIAFPLILAVFSPKELLVLSRSAY